MSASAPVRVEREQSGLAVVSLDAPPLNLYDDAMHQGLEAALDELPSALRRVPAAAVPRSS
jgi:enoyl-CoA hydratase/carnithine racemase